MRAKVTTAIALGLAFGIGALSAPASGPFPALPVAAAEDWQTEFDDICSKTQDAMALGNEELRSLIARCDELQPTIDKLDESLRKVYTRRLGACRKLYRFVLESRGAGLSG